jgi:hypothetical protein
LQAAVHQSWDAGQSGPLCDTRKIDIDSVTGACEPREDTNMRKATWKILTRATAAAALALPLIGTAGTIEPGSAANAAVIPLDPASLNANDCISLGAQRNISHFSLNATKTVLVNRCDYPVAVSYCVDDQSAGARACRNSENQKQPAQIVQPRMTAALDPRSSAADGDGINWIACRSIPGVVGRLHSDGTRGECVAPDNATQAQMSK